MNWARHPLDPLKRLMVQNYLGKWTIVGGLIGIVAGLGATAFYYGIHLVTTLLLGGITGFVPPSPTGEIQSAVGAHPDFLLVPVSTTIGGLIAGLIIYSLAPEAEGHGTDEAIAAFHRRDGKVRHRIPLVKALASIFTLGSGGSGGREGPTAQIGAGFGSFIADSLRLSVRERRVAVAVGLGAGIGAIFKAPFAGAILSGEILYSGGDFEVEALVPAFIAAPAGYLIFGSITGFTPVFGNSSSSYAFTNLASIPVYIALGLACGLVGRLYSTTFYTVRRLFGSLSAPRYFRPMLGAAATGVIGIFFPQILGLGYGFLQYLIDGNLSTISPNFFALPVFLTLLLIVFLKVVATSFTVGSGGSAGVFAPSLVIGGFLGAALWLAVNSAFPGWISTPAPLVIVGMMALFGGVGRAPIAVMLMVSEMTGSVSLLVPAVFAVLVSYFVVGPKYTIYKSQVLRRSDSPAHLGEYSTPLLTKIRVTDAMNPNVFSLVPGESVEVAYRAILDKGYSGVPVAGLSGQVFGIVTMSDLLRVPAERRGATSVESVMTKNVVTTNSDENLLEVMKKIVANEVRQLPVLEKGSSRLIGIMTMTDAIRAYDRVVQGTSGAGMLPSEEP
ncbi:MAG TPA: chloride channel protein [Nitrososphaerales archaeon]|nr:chloride channel protein [Nitrososphaerales archaeon]